MAVPAVPDQDLVDRLTIAKKRRDELQTLYIRQQAAVDQGRARYANIVAELQKYNIGDLKELREKIAQLRSNIAQRLEEALIAMQDVEAKIAAVQDGNQINETQDQKANVAECR